VSYVKQLNGERALAVVDSIDAKVWDNSASLEKIGRIGNRVPLPPSFTIECAG